MVFGQMFIRLGGTGEFDFAKFFNDQPDLITTNGMAFKYVPSIGDGKPCTILGQEDCTLQLKCVLKEDI